MTYKETLFFIGKCLTINHEEHNKKVVKNLLEEDAIDWDNVVKVSTAHYVFPALFCNLKRAGFLDYLPQDLVEYMQHITDLNRERNQQIIEQAKEINKLLLSHNITPIFLKGTGNLLEGLYDDIAERMVGDIDFLVEEKNCKKAFKTLQNKGYTNKISELFEDHRHLPRITNEQKICAVEIHSDILKKSKSKSFNYNSISESLLKKNTLHFLSIKDKIKLSIYSKLINDDAFDLKQIHLRAAYDFFLNCQKLDKPTKLNNKLLQEELDCGIHLYSYLLAEPQKLILQKSSTTQKFVDDCISESITAKYKLNFLKTKLWYSQRLEIIFKSFYNKSYFRFVLSKFTDLKWIKRKLKI